MKDLVEKYLDELSELRETISKKTLTEQLLLTRDSKIIQSKIEILEQIINEFENHNQ